MFANRNNSLGALTFPLVATLGLAAVEANNSIAATTQTPPETNKSASTLVSKPDEEVTTSFNTELGKALGPYHGKMRETGFQQLGIHKKLTHDHYVLHMKQQYFIEKAIDAALRGSENKDVKLLYTDEQKKTLGYIVEDLKALNVKAELLSTTDALPETKVFIDHITKADAREVLGIAYVRFGGLNGGARQIFNRISDSIEKNGGSLPPISKFYTEAEGWSAYRALLDKVTSKQTRELIVRGGHFAYKQTIQLNDNKSFQAK